MILRRKIFIIFTLIWMAFIFSFSSRSGDVSSQDSNHVGMIIGEVFVPGFEQWNDTEQDEFADAIDHPIRKTAHAMEYAVLGFLTAGIFADKRNLGKLRIVHSVADCCRIRGDGRISSAVCSGTERAGIGCDTGQCRSSDRCSDYDGDRMAQSQKNGAERRTERISGLFFHGKTYYNK